MIHVVVNGSDCALDGVTWLEKSNEDIKYSLDFVGCSTNTSSFKFTFYDKTIATLFALKFA